MSDKKMYFGSREVISATAPKVVNPESKEEAETGEVLVEYAEGEPKFEAMPKEEWEAGQSEEPIKDAGDWSKWWVKRSHPVRLEVHKVLEKFNPRFGEIQRLLQWIETAYQEVFKKAINARFKVEDFHADGTYQHIMDELKEEDLKDVPEDVSDIIELLIKHKKGVGETLYGAYFTGMQKNLEGLVNKAFSNVMGSDDEHRRCNDVADVLELWGKADKEGGEPSSVEGVVNRACGEVDDMGEDGEGSEGEAKPEGKTD